MIQEIFNASISGASISAAFECGLFDALRENTEIRLNEFCGSQFHFGSLEAIAYALACFEIVELDRDAGLVRRGNKFDEAYRQKGYFLWLFRGYGNLLQNLGTCIQTSARSDNLDAELGRNYGYIAAAGRDYGSIFVDEKFTSLFDRNPSNYVADLGCGSANRLIKMALANSSLKAVGVDRNISTLNLARTSIATAGLTGRICIVNADVRNLVQIPEFEAVEIALCFFMGHDLWPRDSCARALSNIRRAFPKLRRLLLCDTYRSELPPSSQLSTFTLGFEFVHAIMGQYIPSRPEWLELFPKCGWLCDEEMLIDIPNSVIFDLKPMY